MTRAFIIVLTLLLAACGTSAPAGRQIVALDSRTMGFIDELAHPANAPAQRIKGSLMMPANTVPGVKVPVRCFFTEAEPNVFIEKASNLKVTASSLRYALGLCSAPDPQAEAIYDEAGTADALARLETLVRETLLGRPPQTATVGTSR